MEAEQRETNVAVNNDVDYKELEKETEKQAVIDILMIDSEDSDSHVDSAAVKTGGAAGFSSTWRSVPPFLQKIYEMLENNEIKSVISWSFTGTSFVITDPHLFAANVLPVYFRHNNFQSFVTQLNSYGFKKISWEQWEYKNEYFIKGERHLLKNIRRRNQIPRKNINSSLDASSCDMEKELRILIDDHNSAKAEFMKLKQKHNILDQQIESIRNQAMINKDDQKRIMVVARKILRELISSHDPSINNEVPMLVDKSEAQKKDLKGKRKLKVESVCSAEQGIILLDEEEMGKNQMSTFIPLEDLIGESSEWLELIRNYGGKQVISNSEFKNLEDEKNS